MHSSGPQFASMSTDPEIDATLSATTPRDLELSSRKTIIQQSTDRNSSPQPVNISPNQQQGSHPHQYSWKRLVRRLTLEHFFGATFIFFYYALVPPPSELRSDMVKFMSFVIVPVLMLWGRHDPSDFWEPSSTYASVFMHAFFAMYWLFLSFYFFAKGIVLWMREEITAFYFGFASGQLFPVAYICGRILVFVLNRWVLPV